MRFTTYTRDLAKGGYKVIGGAHLNGRERVWDSECIWDSADTNEHSSIHMSLTCTPNGRPLGADFDTLVQFAESDMFVDDDYARKYYADFREHYAEILRGNYPNWHLYAFQIFVGGIELFFTNFKTNESGFLWIVAAPRVELTFMTPCTRLGYNPIYKVHIRNERGETPFTVVEEDLGYISYENRFMLKDSCKEDDNLFHDDNQYLIVTEYAGW